MVRYTGCITMQIGEGPVYLGLGLGPAAVKHNFTFEDQRRIQDFPLGAANSVGGADVQRGCFLAKTHAKTKELGPIWGAHPLDLPVKMAATKQLQNKTTAAKHDKTHKIAANLTSYAVSNQITINCFVTHIYTYQDVYEFRSS